MASVGIIANPAAGKDIRRLVAQGRFVPNQEKVNILKRILAGLDAVGVERVVMMPDMARLGNGALDGGKYRLDVSFADMIVFNAQRDSVRAAGIMAEMGVGCIITLGGDGTNQAVAKGCGDVPLVPVSTGTNNVFPVMAEGTLAGIAAGLVASGSVSPESTTARSKRLEVHVEGELRDIALVDVAISKERFVGARAIWDMQTVEELYLARAEPASIGLSAIGAQLMPVSLTDERGLHIRFGEGGESVVAPVAPGMVMPVGIERWDEVGFGDRVEVELRPCTVALDGERAFSLRPGEQAHVELSPSGPRVVLIEETLREAAIDGVFREKTEAEQAG